MRAVAMTVVALGVAVLVWVGVSGNDEPGAGAAASADDDPSRAATSSAETGAAQLPAGPGPAARRTPPRLPATTAGTAAAAERPLGERPLFDDADAEQRDPAWASETEAAIRARVDTLLAGRDDTAVPQLECRETVCRLLITSGDEDALRGFAADLNSERGFVGRANLLAFEDTERGADPDGAPRYALRVMLAYRR